MVGVSSASAVLGCGCGVGLLLRRFSSGGPPSPKERVRLIIFDFDQTLSVIHVFKTLAGWRGGEASLRIDGPASTELGQLRLIGNSRTDTSDFPVSALGGPARIQRLRHVLSSIRERQTKMCICTKGLVGPTRKILEATGLLEFFDEVYGRTDDTYGVEPYDAEQLRRPPTDRESRLLGTMQSDWGSKRDLIDRLMEENNLRYHQVLLVEDDAAEIELADDACRTLFVREGTGMREQHFKELLRLTTFLVDMTQEDVVGFEKAQVATAFLVDNSQLNTHSESIGFRRSKNVDDRIGHGAAVKFGSIVAGVADGDWVKVSEDRYLPVFLEGKKVLVPRHQIENRLAQHLRHEADVASRLAKMTREEQDAAEELAQIKAELAAAKKAGPATAFLVDSRNVVGFRSSKNIDDKSACDGVKFGSLVVGVKEGDWVKVSENRYLPIVLEGEKVLVPRDQIERRLRLHVQS